MARHLYMSFKFTFSNSENMYKHAGSIIGIVFFCCNYILVVYSFQLSPTE